MDARSGTESFDLLFKVFCSPSVDGFNSDEADFMYEFFNDVKLYTIVQAHDAVKMINKKSLKNEQNIDNFKIQEEQILSKLESINCTLDQNPSHKISKSKLVNLMNSPYFLTIFKTFDSLVTFNDEHFNSPSEKTIETQFDESFPIEPEIYPIEQDNDRVMSKSMSSYKQEHKESNVFDNEPEQYSRGKSHQLSSICKTVVLYKIPGEPLGFTVMQDNVNVIVARIIMDSRIEQQKLLRLGDVIIQVNDRPITSAQQVRDLIKYSGANSTIKLGVVPFQMAHKYLNSHSLSRSQPQINENLSNDSKNSKLYVRAFFDYNYNDSPDLFKKCPCSDLNLPFKRGDILKIIRQDGSWWQAIRLANKKQGLIPSHKLSEKYESECNGENEKSLSSSFLSSFTCGLVSPKKKKKSVNFPKKRLSINDKSLDIPVPQDVATYENVICVPPFKRRVIIIVGPKGIGRRTMKTKLIKMEPQKYTSVVPTTSRPPRPDELDGDIFQFESENVMQNEIQSGGYVEWGKFDNHYYGTAFNSIDAILDTNPSNLSVVLDLSPQVLKQIRTERYKPLIIFVAAPHLDKLRSMYREAHDSGKTNKVFTEHDLENTVKESRIIEKYYFRYFDTIIKNEGLEECFMELRNKIEYYSSKPNWIPISWNI
ncbi:hypothetical protein A3Q56_01368 [Intoshia linei]|uniref:MAGUK p55 subfamily member 6 n=1 Tax=Intoshia linei TaxID=1819745 RepID=A0A177BBF7_9BILA|nr:hypothetical protein A3Q56_01368 [Intoshia linei]